MCQGRPTRRSAPGFVGLAHFATMDERSPSPGSRAARGDLTRARLLEAARAGLDVAVVAQALAAIVDTTVSRLLDTVERGRLVDGLTDVWVHAVYR